MTYANKIKNSVVEQAALENRKVTRRAGMPRETKGRFEQLRAWTQMCWSAT